MNLVEPKSSCPCGQTLPWHLFELGLGLTHVCLCNRTYRQDKTSGKVEQVGNSPNPFTDAPTGEAPWSGSGDA